MENMNKQVSSAQLGYYWFLDKGNILESLESVKILRPDIYEDLRTFFTTEELLAEKLTPSGKGLIADYLNGVTKRNREYEKIFRELYSFIYYYDDRKAGVLVDFNRNVPYKELIDPPKKII